MVIKIINLLILVADHEYFFFSRNIRISQLSDTKEQKGNSRVPGWWFKEIGISRL